MKKISLRAFVIFLLFSTSTSKAVELLERYLSVPGTPKEKHKIYAYIENKKQVLLPDRSVFINAVTNESKTLCAVNCHLVSNANDAILLAENPSKNGNIILIENVWSKVENEAIKRGIMPNYPWHVTSFQILAIKGSTLTCSFYSACPTPPAEIDIKNIKIDVDVQKDTVHFHLRKWSDVVQD